MIPIVTRNSPPSRITNPNEGKNHTLHQVVMINQTPTQEPRASTLARATFYRPLAARFLCLVNVRTQLRRFSWIHIRRKALVAPAGPNRHPYVL